MLNFTSVTTTGVALETLYSFTTNSIGDYPEGGLMLASNGIFYGTAFSGGSPGNGTVFRMDTNGVVTLVYAFPNDTGGNNPPYGANPFAALIQGTNGLLYGTATSGGSLGDGTVFRMTTNGTSVAAWSLNSASTGRRPLPGWSRGRTVTFMEPRKWAGLMATARFSN